MKQIALPFPRVYVRVDCSRVDSAGVLWQWNHIVDQETLAATIEHIKEALPDVTVTVRKGEDGKPKDVTRGRGLRKREKHGDPGSDPVC